MTTPFDAEMVYAWVDPLSESQVAELLVAADYALSNGDEHFAVAALDRAYGARPGESTIAKQRASVLDRLAFEEHGLRFRYIPGGTFLMGSNSGDPDERPIHPRRVEPFFMADTPVSYEDYCRLRGWEPPPLGMPKSPAQTGVVAVTDIKIRRHYCRRIIGARDAGQLTTSWDLPMVAVTWSDVVGLLLCLSPEFDVPTEAEWEKAARGGLVGRAYPWGDEPPQKELCDFDRFGDFTMRLPRTLPPNGYGLYGMAGGVSEWTRDRYDALAYQHHHRLGPSPAAPPSTEPIVRVTRGGSWADCAAAVTVSFRATQSNPGPSTPNIGVRLVKRLAARTPYD
ncbi:MAG: SUMF1/EgtB/PvdO family nonheme iron enzyme [Polyangiaceae bacterium]